jgi:hypothetical protein
MIIEVALLQSNFVCHDLICIILAAFGMLNDSLPGSLYSTCVNKRQTFDFLCVCVSTSRWLAHIHICMF